MQIFWPLFLIRVGALQLNITPSILYYEVTSHARMKLFSAGMYEAPEMQMALVGLLTMKEMDFKDDYKHCHLPEAAAMTLVQAFFKINKLHATVFPFDFVCRNVHLRRLIKLEDYHPGIVNLIDNQFGEKELKLIMANIGSNLRQYGDIWTVREAIKLGNFPFVPGSSTQQCIMQILDLTIRKEGVDQICAMFDNLHDSSKWKTTYCRIRELLEIEASFMSRSIQAMWYGMLLLIVLDSVKIPCKPKIHADLNIIVHEYFYSYSVEDLPPFLLERMVNTCIRHKLTLTGDAQLDEVARTLRSIFPIKRSLGGSIFDHIACWRNALHLSSGRQLRIPQGEQSYSDLISWWGGYKSLGRLLLVNPQLSSPLYIRDSDPIQCTTITCFLHVITVLIMSKEKIVDIVSKPEMRQRQVSPILLRAFLRTVLSNILYLGNVNFSIPLEALSWLSGTAHGDPLIFRQLEDLCRPTWVSTFIPVELVVKDPAVE
ncbi:hypothetical protein PSACC_00189 [Paramicrosporidium saccamoebae]|uniref:Uncharacterized protein n=1 Tax=Paramicrosporidium saccamoebae TaxID=1246581 RepID=A0A2H9TQM3_9FUNG|nr:hypothetical protein PSACC_00189 [Paramicrosporidium saccamoebae]